MTMLSVFNWIFCRRKKITLQSIKDSSAPVEVIIPAGDFAIYSLLQDDTKAIPFAYAIINRQPDSNNEALLWFIYCREAHRRHGHAERLLQYLQSKFDVLITHYETMTSLGTKLCMKCGFELKPSMYKNRPNELIWKAKR